MAYTYDNFTQAATQAGLLSGFSEEDLKLAQTNPEFGLSVLKLRQDAAGAKTTEQKLLAQEAENQLRNSFAAAPGNTGGFTFDKQKEFDALFDKVSNYEPFSYDPESDVRFGSYKKNYLREAERARSDTLAKVSAATGGVPSSWAIGAADQAGNYYTGKLNDVIPTLYSDALNQHLQEYNANLNAFAAMKDERDFDYNAYLQEWNNAMQLYNMGIRTPEIYKILGIPEPEPVTYYGGEEEEKKTTGGSWKPKPKEEQAVEDSSLLDNTVTTNKDTGKIPLLNELFPNVGYYPVKVPSWKR